MSGPVIPDPFVLPAELVELILVQTPGVESERWNAIVERFYRKQWPPPAPAKPWDEWLRDTTELLEEQDERARERNGVSR